MDGETKIKLILRTRIVVIPKNITTKDACECDGSSDGEYLAIRVLAAQCCRWSEAVVIDAGIRSE